MSTDIRFADGTLYVTRTYAAPREVVFEAWVETGQVQQWWGCAEATEIRSEIDPRVGGAYSHHMTLHGHIDVPGPGVFTEYDPPKRLAYRSSEPDEMSRAMLVTVDFLEVEGGTEVRLAHSGIPDMRVQGDVELRAVIQDGWTAAFGKLHTFLETGAVR